MKSLLSEVDKWSQKYTWYRKITVISLVILIISITIFFLNLSSLFTSTICLIISFIAVLAIRIGLSKMDEFKSLYVNTVPMIDPEKDFKEGQALNEAQNQGATIEAINEMVELDDKTLSENEPLLEEVVVETELAKVFTQNQMEEFKELDQVHQAEEVSEETKEVLPLESKEIKEETEEVMTMEANNPELEVQEEVLADELQEIKTCEIEAEEEETFSSHSEEILLPELEVTQPSSDLEASIREANDTVNEKNLSLEEQVFETVRVILRQNHCNVEELSFKTVSNYLTIYVKNRVLMRIKLTGRKQYVLTYLSQSEVESLGLAFEAPSKSEAYTSRVKFTSIVVLAQLESQIVYMYKRIEK